MPNLAVLKQFLHEVPDLSLGNNEIHFFEPDELEDRQRGYRIDENGRLLVAGRNGGWQENWIVIATDYEGDPIFVDMGSPGLPVLTDIEGEMISDPFMIADSFDKFKEVILLLERVSKNRGSAADLEANPIDDDEWETISTAIKTIVPHSEIDYWDMYIEG